MFDMTGYVELKRLLTKVEAIEEKLMPNELEMLGSLQAKYVEPLNPNPFDATSLNVMLRNVEIRKGYRFDPRRDGSRVINLPRTGVSKKKLDGRHLRAGCRRFGLVISRRLIPW